MASENNVRESTFVNQDGLTLFYRFWPPESDHRANLIIAHGLGEHCGRYAHVAHFFNQKGIGVFALDHQGHGRSEGKRGHVDQFDNFIRDLEALRQIGVDTGSERPTIFFGHSMGGLVLALYLLNDQNHCDAAILSAPAIAIKSMRPWLSRVIAVAARLLPSVRTNNQIPASDLSHDPQVVKNYENDPLVHPLISFSLLDGMIKGGQRCRQDAHRIECPLMMVFGNEDRIVQITTAEEMFEKTSSSNKTFITFEGFHEIHNEAVKEDEFAAMWNWLKTFL